MKAETLKIILDEHTRRIRELVIANMSGRESKDNILVSLAQLEKEIGGIKEKDMKEQI